MKTVTRRSSMALATTAALSLVLALSACSTGADEALEPETETPGELTSLAVANLPIADQGSYFYALENGIFEEHGLEIERVDATGGSAAIAAMVAGEFDVAYSGADGVIKAAANGLDVKIIAGANTNEPSGDSDSTGLVVAPGITDLSQLEGATLATNALGNINQVYAQEFLAQNGVENVTVVEVPFPEQVAALQAGQIQATLLPEPFASQALAAGATKLGWPYRIGEDETTQVGVFVSTGAVIAEKADAIQAFVDAMTEASEAANDPANRDAVVAAILANTKLESDVADNMTFVHFSTDITVEGIQATADLLVKYGILPTDVDVSGFFAE